MRYCVHGLYASPGGNRPSADREICPRARNSDSLPAHRRPVRSLRERAVSYRGRESGLGRGELALADPDKSRRPVHGEFHRFGDGTASRGETAGHPGYRNLQGPLLSYQPLGLRIYGRGTRQRLAGWARRQARCDHRHGRDGDPVRAASRARLPGALRLPENALVRGRARKRPYRSRLVFVDRDARVATALAGKLHRQFSGWVGDGRPGSGRLDRSVAANPREDEADAAWRTDAADGVGGIRRFRFRKDGGNTRADRRHRDAWRNGAETQGLVSAALQAPVLPR